MKKLKLGYAPTRRFTFSAEDAFRYKVMIKEKLLSFGMDIDVVDLEGLNEEGLLYDDHINADLIAERFKRENVDAVFFPHCNFGTEDTVARVGKALGKPVLLWGRETRRRLRTACGCAIRSADCSQPARCSDASMCRSPM